MKSTRMTLVAAGLVVWFGEGRMFGFELEFLQNLSGLLQSAIKITVQNHLYRTISMVAPGGSFGNLETF